MDAIFITYLSLLAANTMVWGYLYHRQKKRGDEWREAWRRASMKFGVEQSAKSTTFDLWQLETTHACGHTDAEHESMMQKALNEKKDEWPIVLTKGQIANLMAALHKEESDNIT